MECLLPYLRMVIVPHIMVGLERMLDYRGAGLARFHCTVRWRLNDSARRAESLESRTSPMKSGRGLVHKNTSIPIHPQVCDGMQLP